MGRAESDMAACPRGTRLPDDGVPAEGGTGYYWGAHQTRLGSKQRCRDVPRRVRPREPPGVRPHRR
jgi:hypothetical protein